MTDHMEVHDHHDPASVTDLGLSPVVTEPCPLWTSEDLEPHAATYHSPAYTALKELRAEMRRASDLMVAHRKKEREWQQTRRMLADQAKMAEQARASVQTMYTESMEREKALRSGMDAASDMLRREGYHTGNLLTKIECLIADKQKASRDASRYAFYVKGLTTRSDAPSKLKPAG